MWTFRLKNNQDKQKDGHTDRQAERQIKGCTNRLTNNKDRQKDGQTY